MKKIALIFLISIYALSTTGMSLKSVYCCDQLKSLSVTLAQTGKQKCAMGDEKGGCCKTEYQFFKLKDNHVMADDAVNHVFHFFIISPLSSSLHIPVRISTQVNFINTAHSPPLHYGVPVYISNCIFRI